MYFFSLLAGSDLIKAYIKFLFDILLLIFLALAINFKVFKEYAFNFLIFSTSLSVMLFLLANLLNFNFFSSLLILFCFLFWISHYIWFFSILFSLFLVVVFFFALRTLLKSLAWVRKALIFILLILFLFLYSAKKITKVNLFSKECL